MLRHHILSGPADFASNRPYPELADIEPRWHDKLGDWLYQQLLAPLRGQLEDFPAQQQKIVAATERHSADFQALDDQQLQQQARNMRSRLRRQGFTLALSAECFALIREASARTLQLRHYPSQLIGGWGLLQGKLVEMATGEGKTLVATLPASVVALAGYPVHVITVNDYLAERDAQKMQPLYRFLGLSVGVVKQGMEKPQRRQAYSQNITYCTNKELAFDYLRDSIELKNRSSSLHLALDTLSGQSNRANELVLQGLYFAIVDEADSVFIDEARTPLILSASVHDAQQAEDSQHALALAGRLQCDQHYTLQRQQREIRLSDEGKDWIGQQVAQQQLTGVWTSVRAREELITQALTAVLLFHKDQHYVISPENKIQIVDESTGRVMADRSWERGLHQLIEVKENCEITARRETLARLTYPKLFQRYMRLSGMTGTAQEVRAEIRSTYKLSVSRVPLNKASRRMYLPPRVFAHEADKWQAVAQRVAEQVALQRPVLIGTRSVKASEQISERLQQQGIAHRLLNAKQNDQEADIIACAGQPAQVTVATNMAGRGTDIELGAGVEQAGGLHVILTEYHESRRVDRQLFGRCARQGDPGSCEAIVSLEDELFSLYAPEVTRWCRQLLTQQQLPAWLLQKLVNRAQSNAEAKAKNMRIHTNKQDQRLNKMLAFSGRGE